jgi:hypothetical protein
MPEERQPHAEVRHERKDANLRWVLAFAVILIGAAITGHVLLYWLLGGLERRQEAAESRGASLPPIARENRPHFPAQLDVIREKHKGPALQVADTRDMEEQLRAENAVLGGYGWSNVAKGAVYIPIEEALRRVQDPEKARAHGIVAREMKEGK